MRNIKKKNKKKKNCRWIVDFEIVKNLRGHFPAFFNFLSKWHSPPCQCVTSCQHVN